MLYFLWRRRRLLFNRILNSWWNTTQWWQCLNILLKLCKPWCKHIQINSKDKIRNIKQIHNIQTSIASDIVFIAVFSQTSITSTSTEVIGQDGNMTRLHPQPSTNYHRTPAQHFWTLRATTLKQCLNATNERVADPMRSLLRNAVIFLLYLSIPPFATIMYSASPLAVLPSDQSPASQ